MTTTGTAVAPITRTHLLNLLSLSTAADLRRTNASNDYFAAPVPSDTVRAEFREAVRDSSTAYVNLIDAIHELDIPS